MMERHEKHAHIIRTGLIEAAEIIGNKIAYAITQLGNGNAATPMGAIEAHGVAIRDAADTIATAMYDALHPPTELPPTKKKTPLSGRGPQMRSAGLDQNRPTV